MSHACFAKFFDRLCRMTTRQRIRAALTGCLVCVPGAVFAQGTTTGNPSSTTRDAAVDALRQEWSAIVSNIGRAAELMPDSSYSYRPVPTVMSFGELLAHVSSTQFSTCGSALGVSAPADSARPATNSKSELRQHYVASIAFCQRAYLQNVSAISDRPHEVSRRYFGLVHNTAHVNEHYGNMVTYMRMLGLVPPSSSR